MDAFEIPGKYSKLLLNNKLLLFVPNLAVTQMATWGWHEKLRESLYTFQFNNLQF